MKRLGENQLGKSQSVRRSFQGLSNTRLFATTLWLATQTSCGSASTCPKGASHNSSASTSVATTHRPKSNLASIPRPGAPFAITRRQNYRIEFGAYGFEIDPFGGARINEFSLEGKSIIVPAKESPEANGSSIWPSPQSDWIWPPPPELDTLPWSVRIDHQTLVLESDVSEKLGLQVVQSITAEPEIGSVLIDYEFINRGKSARKVSPWQNTRVRPKGLTFYPASQPTYDFPDNTLVITPHEGVSWYQHKPSEVTRDSIKSYADGEEGWVAQVDGKLLFIKQFEDTKPGERAPKEGEVVLYVDVNGRFVEVEQQGRYAEIAPGTSRHWKVRWVLRILPNRIKPEAGNLELVKFVRDELSRIVQAHSDSQPTQQ